MSAGEDLVIAASAMVLHRGGLRLCGDLLAALKCSLRFCPRSARLGRAIEAAELVLAARDACDDVAFDAARDALSREVSALLAGKAHDQLRRARGV
ncbi:hypothetical protein KO516_18275 [Citreicella sp. C3M06]|uniref:hypothetical protein n=1 Tax=Citreicella sp. C3M06 TaxID=2841564 RepID=UPI001C083AF3|nr:hypothetical protein [Citreicella sp. C3M06]MBU2962738.1 hypothetical protein [Citreicella sp. C3M06]